MPTLSPLARGLILAVTISIAIAFPLLVVEDAVSLRVAIITLTCLGLWMTATVPPFVPTLLLWVSIPLLLGGSGVEFSLGSVLGWSADPVLALFFGGFALSVAGSRHGIDQRVASIAARLSGGNRIGLLAVTACATAMLSMWMSNIAAAAMMLGALRPLYSGMALDDPFRRALILSVAFAADFGGIGTPIGSGPNAIAMAAASRGMPISFVNWMMFGVPLAAALTALAVLLVAVRFRVKGRVSLHLPATQPWSRQSVAVVVVFFATVGIWLTEPLHGIASAVVSLGAAGALFGFGLLTREDIGRMDWATLMLIAGGLALGRLIEQSGVIADAAAAAHLGDMQRSVAVFALVFTTASLAGLMSNTATATMLVPLAAAVNPAPSMVIMVAIAASLGVPLIISTPPNAMAFGEGGLRASDLLVPGLILMLTGCALVALTGPAVLGAAGIR